MMRFLNEEKKEKPENPEGSEKSEKTGLDNNDFGIWHKELFVALSIGAVILILVGLVALGFIPIQEIDDAKLKDAVLIETVTVDKTPVQFSYFLNYLNEVDDEGAQQ
ncbi:MAG: hypothetical protein ACD_21C00021G0002 [uncultured bacterium]|nr:MAG: hypothetical protein ACD_21C00021G0002 [uncultured bacterium]